MRKISILNFKGGVGKSSLAMNLAHALALRGLNVLLIDCDLQGNANTLLREQRAPTLTDVLKETASLSAAIQEARPGLYVVPADRELDSAAKHIAQKRRTYYTLRHALDKLQGYDVVFFDQSPNYNPITETALLASGEMLVPVQLAPFAMQGLGEMFNKLESELEDYELTITGIVPSMVDLRYSMSQQYLTALLSHFPGRITQTIRTDATVARAQSVGQTVFEYDETCKAAEDYRALAAQQFIEEKVQV